jgi:hypothetical protein
MAGFMLMGELVNAAPRGCVASRPSREAGTILGSDRDACSASDQ